MNTMADLLDDGDLAGKAEGQEAEDAQEEEEKRSTWDVIRGAVFGKKKKKKEVLLHERKASGKGSEGGIPAACVIGTTVATYTQLTTPLGKMIAEKGYDLITGNTGGNMDAIREAFFTTNVTSATHNRTKGKSLWRLPKNWSQWHEKPLFKLYPPNVDQGSWWACEDWLVCKACDVVIALPGGPSTRKEIKDAIDRGKPLIGFITDDDVNVLQDSKSEDDVFKEMMSGKSVAANQIVKNAVPAKSCYYLKDIDMVDEFLDRYAPPEINASSGPSRMCEPHCQNQSSQQSSANLQNALLSPLSVIACLSLLTPH